MFRALDHAYMQFARSTGAVITRSLTAQERDAHMPDQYIVPAVVAYEMIRAELKQHDSLWHIAVTASVQHTSTGPTRDDPLGQRPQAEQPSLSVAFIRLADGARKYMLTFEGEATEIATIEEVIERLKSLYARALVEGP